MKPLANDIWGGLISAEMQEQLKGVLVEKVVSKRSQSEILILLKSVIPLKGVTLNLLCEKLTNYFSEFKTISIKNNFDYDYINAEAILVIVEDLKKQGFPINGFLSGAKIDIKQTDINIEIAMGLNLLKNIKFSEKLSGAIHETTGVRPEITLASNSNLCVEKAQEVKQVVKPQPAPQAKDKKTTTAKKEYTIKGLVLDDTPAKVFHGKSFKPTNVISLKEVGYDSGKCMVWGDVFFSEVKGSYMKSYVISITDYTGSINLKVRCQREDNPAKWEKKWEKLQKGDTIIVKGNCYFEKYESDYVIDPDSIMIVGRQQRQDKALTGEKRVELHLHTKLSSMDALIDPATVVNTAHKWGHRAVAITDHAVVQAFPLAMEAVEKIQKTDPDFKLIYGVEAYFVDDMVACTYGDLHANLDSEFVVFDLETTGFSPKTEKMTEIGAVILKNGVIIEEFSTFVNPEKHIPEKITQITGINDSMVKGAPSQNEAIKAFLSFAGNRPLVAHNAHGFDMKFVKEAVSNAGVTCNNTYIDTVPIAQNIYKTLKNHKLDTLNKHLQLEGFNHHRATDDAKALAMIFVKLIEELNEKSIYTIQDINTKIGSSKTNLKRAYHMIILVQTQAGLKNLYKLISTSHIDYFYKTPRIPRSVLNKYREGLIIGSACEAGEVYKEIMSGASFAEVCEKAKYYDFLEVQPNGNNMFMVRSGAVKNEKELEKNVKTIVDIAKTLGKPCVATGDVHFLNPEDSIYRTVLMAGKGFKDADDQAPLHFKTTQEMLYDFAYLGEELAYELVVTNPNKIADMVDSGIRAIPKGSFKPNVENADETLRQDTINNAKARYGDPLPEVIEKRLERELESIIKHGFAGLYVIAQKLVLHSEKNGYLVGSRGSVGSSAVAHFSGISEVNSMQPHYLCPNCKWSEFFLNGEVADGFDLEEKNCPNCSTQLICDGHDIPFETFLGFDGDKEPDIDLNFSGEFQSESHRYTEEIFGKQFVFKAGTISGIQDKTAYGYVKKYLDERNIVVNKAEENRLVKGCVGVKRTTGQHPGGMIVVPDDKDIYDFCPIQHPADDKEKGVYTTHFEFKFLHDTLLKLDELGHDVPTMYKYLNQQTGVKMEDIPMNDPKVINLLISTESLGVTPQQIDSETGTFGIPELGTHFVRNMLVEAQPQTFSDLIQISGLSHGTDVWNGNAQDLIKDGICTISDVIGTRDSIMTYLLHKGLEPATAFKIMELTRKGIVAKNGFPDGVEQIMRDKGIPDWYINSCKKIKYMFPKAHAVAYLIAAMRLMWFKVYHPLAFYATYFTVRGADIDYEAAIGGYKVAQQRLKEVTKRIKEEKSKKDEDLLASLQIVCEILARGIKFAPIQIGVSKAREYVIDNGEIRLPYLALKGIGETAADSLEKTGERASSILSVEEFQRASGISSTAVDQLYNMGVLSHLPKSNQVSFF